MCGVGMTHVAIAAGEKQAEIKARQAFAAARYDEAIEIFAQLYAETLNPIYLRNIGRCHQKKHDPDKAIDTFQDYLTNGKVSGTERKEIQGYIKEMEQLRDEQAKEREAAAAAKAPPPAPPPIPVAVNVTPSSVTTLPPPSDATTPTLVAMPGSRQPQEESHPVYTRWWFWTAIGVVAAGGIAAALLIPGGTTKPPCPTVCQ
jgi:hypothetical protein